MPFAEVKNSDGEFVKPTLNRSRLRWRPRKSRMIFVFRSRMRPERAPIQLRRDLALGLRTAEGPPKGKKLVEFLKWALNKGDGMAQTLIMHLFPTSCALVC